MTDPKSESHALRGAPDATALRRFRDVFETQEPLASGELDDSINPQTLEVHLSDGVGTAETARIDVRWSTTDDYNVHYTDSAGTNLRWDLHPHEYPAPSDDSHFHPPPDASTDPDDVEASCLNQTRVDIVARAAHKLWRRVYDQDSFEGVNAAENPP
jgi:hypothetical protein